MSSVEQRGRFVRMFSSAVINQALLSGASLLVSLILLRHTSDHQYGYYVLVVAALLLVTSLQNSFYAPPLVSRMTRFDAVQRGQLVGGLYREQRTVWVAAIGIAMLFTGLLWMDGLLNSDTGPIVLAALAVALLSLHREYFRTVLLAYRRSHDVLVADVFYVVLMVAGAAVATLTARPAVTAILTLGFAALVCGTLLKRFLRRHEAMDMTGSPGILREIAPLAMWATAGAVVHWSFSQGYSYLVAGTLDITAVAAIGATRLSMMPVNLLSTGIGSLMLPLSANWLHHHGAAKTFRRLCLFAGGLVFAAVLYFIVMWILRDWLFAVVLKKQFAQRDVLLELWGAVVLVTVVRDQLLFLPLSRQRFHILTGLSLVCAFASLSVSYVCMKRLGVSGALIGILTGELLNVLGLVLLSLQEIQRDRRQALHGAGSPSGS